MAQAGGGAHLRARKRLGCQEQRGSVPSCRSHNKGRVHISQLPLPFEQPSASPCGPVWHGLHRSPEAL